MGGDFMSVTRITGMVSGFDTDTLIKDMMKAEQSKYDKLDRNKQYLEWEQEAYRDIISTLSGFQSEYFDVLNGDKNIRSTNAFSKFSSTTTVNGVSNSAVTVSANSDIKSFEHTISQIKSLATKDTWNGSISYISSVKSAGLDDVKLETLKTEGIEFSVSIDRSAKVLSLSAEELETASGGDELSVDELVSALNAKIGETFGEDFNGIVEKVNIDGNDEIKFDYPGNNIVLLNSGDSETLQTLGITNGSSNYEYSSKAIGEILGITEEELSNLSINGKAITGLTVDDDIRTMINKINALNIGAKLSYNDVEDKFILQSENEGSLNNITMDNEATEAFFSKLSIEDGANRISASNAVVVIDDIEIVKSTNSFNIEGVNYTLNEEYSGDDINIKINQNTDDVYDFIKGFVEKYNEVIENLNGRLSEVKDYDFKPLTDAEKEELSEDEIDKWENQAKKGILSSDSTIGTLLTKMRQSLYESVENVGLNLRDIGITSSSDYTERGKLEIDDSTLKDAINNNFSEMVRLFTSESETEYSDKDNRNVRYEENGIAYRIHDLLQDYVRTSRDGNNQKGILIEKAGKEGDTSFFTNMLSEKITEYDTRIDETLDYLADKEDYYYNMFAQMEAALSKMESQMSWFNQQMGTSG